MPAEAMRRRGSSLAMLRRTIRRVEISGDTASTEPRDPRGGDRCRWGYLPGWSLAIRAKVVVRRHMGRRVAPNI